MKNEKPIKFVYENDYTIKSSGDHDITISRKATLFEIANLFGVNIQDVLEGKIGYWILDEERKNNKC